MAVDMFLKLDGIKGETMDAKHKGEIEILSWSWALIQPSSAGSGAGSGAGKVQVHDIVVSKTVDVASPNLIAFCCQGKHIKTATLAVRKAGGEQQDYLKITLEDVLITSVQPGGNAANELPMEEVKLNFAKFKYSYAPQKADGTLEAAVEAGWDVKQNVKV